MRKQANDGKKVKAWYLLSDGTEPLFRDTFILTVDGD